MHSRRVMQPPGSGLRALGGASEKLALGPRGSEGRRKPLRVRGGCWPREWGWWEINYFDKTSRNFTGLTWVDILSTVMFF